VTRPMLFIVFLTFNKFNDSKYYVLISIISAIYIFYFLLFLNVKLYMLFSPDFLSLKWGMQKIHVFGEFFNSN